MTSSLDGFFKNKFNHSAAAHLANDMLQAFFRREHDTITYLEKKGARFTEEMLLISIGFRDHYLTEKCLQKGINPTDEHLRAAVDSRDAEIFKTVAAKTRMSEAIRNYVVDSGTKDMRTVLSPAEKIKTEEHPVLRVNTAMLSVP